VSERTSGQPGASAHAQIGTWAGQRVAALRAAGAAVFGRRWGGWLAILVLTLPALWPLVRPGFFVSDDGLFHVYRVAALAEAWRHGVFYPRLFPEFGFGYGQAVLNFYAPLTYVPGAVLALVGINPATAVELTIALGFLLAGLAMYGFVRSLWGPVGGALAAVAYTYFPYHLADAYLRGAVPEHFAFIFPPLILWATTGIFRAERPIRPLLWAALAWAGLLYTHNLTALLMAPTWALYALVMALWTRRIGRLAATIGVLALALGLSAPLWLPFLAESRWVGIALGPSDGYKRHLAPLDLLIQWQPFYRYRVQHGGQADHPLSWLTAMMCLLALGLFAWRLVRRQRAEAAPIIGLGLLLTCGATFMITQASLFVWQPLTPILAHLQYPWRFLAVTAVGFALAVGALPALTGRGGRRERQRAVAALALGGALLVQPLPTIAVQPLSLPAADVWSADRMWREDAAMGQVGATWTGEFLPLTVEEQRWALGRPAERPMDGPPITPPPRVRLTRLGYDQVELTVETAVPMSVRLHQFHLPAWRAWLDGRPLATRPTGELGLVTADLPAGGGRLHFAFGPTAAWLIGGGLALVAGLIWAALAWRGRVADRKPAWAAAMLLAIIVLLLLNRLGVGRQMWTPRPVNATMGDVALLLGYDAAPTRGADALDVTLYWFALRDVAANYKTFVHLLGPDGGVIAQHDGDPGGGFTPTSRWRSGELIADRHRVPTPAGLPAGEYGLKAGMYQPEPLRNLPVEPATADGRVDLGTVRLPVR